MPNSLLEVRDSESRMLSGLGLRSDFLETKSRLNFYFKGHHFYHAAMRQNNFTGRESGKKFRP